MKTIEEIHTKLVRLSELRSYLDDRKCLGSISVSDYRNESKHIDSMVVALNWVLEA